MSDFKLGDPVTILGTKRKYRRGHTSGPSVTYVDGPVPSRKIWSKEKGDHLKFLPDGIVIGKRTLSEHDVEWENDGYGRYIVMAPRANTHFEVYLVAFDMRRRPVMCLPEQIKEREEVE